jgi:hypothetical protein
MRQRAPILVVMVTALALAACGRGADGDGSGGGLSTASSPEIVIQPASRAVAVGASVTFDVSAIGASPLSYQWYRDGTAVAGATDATYSVPATVLSDDGARFSVVVSNPAGSARSDPATLGVFSTPGTAITCTSPGDAFTPFASALVAVGKAAGAIVAGCSGPLAEVVWTQTGGPPVTLMSDRTQAIGFEPPQPGTYEFTVTFQDAQGAAQSAPVSIVAAGASAGSRIVARVDQAVRQGGDVSIRAWPTLAAGDAVQSIAWAQLEGPPLVLDTSDPSRILFTAPDVARDTLLRFRVTMRTTSGVTDSDDALVLVEKYDQAPASDAYAWAGYHVSRVYPYRSQSPWASVLARCVFDALLQRSGPGKNLCPLSTLPFLDQETGGGLPTIDQVMDRVLVSHGWMGDVFQQFLQAHDPDGDFRRLLNGVTAIVIGAHVRPSMTSFVTGAIYLDADELWLLPAQRDVIGEEPDYRSTFGAELRYSGPWRYVLNGEYAWYGYPASVRTERTLVDILYPVSSLLYHELAHASDALPPAVRGSLDGDLSAWDNVAPRLTARQLPSDVLGETYPLASQEMFALAAVKFGGNPATAEQEAFSPDEVAGFFRPDGANHEYAYSGDREDLAMLFEEVMMSYRYGVRMDFAIADPVTPSTTGNTLVVRWGERGRVTEPQVKPRAKLVVEHIAPWVAPDVVDTLPPPIAMRAGASWFGNLALSPPPSGTRALSTRMLDLTPEEERLLLRRDTRRP